MSNPLPYQQPGSNGPKRLTRSRDDRMISGVCGGLARYLNVDATLIRVLMVVALLVGFFTPGLAYLIAWALIPEED
jgi:phage shock protein PspC (stress-responsive transcriptional regulator)